jgi:hypothetical protein
MATTTHQERTTMTTTNPITAINEMRWLPGGAAGPFGVHGHCTARESRTTPQTFDIYAYYQGDEVRVQRGLNHDAAVAEINRINELQDAGVDIFGEDS